jgi:hypothetical protein
LTESLDETASTKIARNIPSADQQNLVKANFGQLFPEANLGQVVQNSGAVTKKIKPVKRFN